MFVWFLGMSECAYTSNDRPFLRIKTTTYSLYVRKFENGDYPEGYALRYHGNKGVWPQNVFKYICSAWLSMFWGSLIQFKSIRHLKNI